MYVIFPLQVVAECFKVQTDEEVHEDIQLYEDDSPELADFLRRIEPHVYKELQKNRRSHAFDGQCLVQGFPTGLEFKAGFLNGLEFYNTQNVLGLKMIVCS